MLGAGFSSFHEIVANASLSELEQCRDVFKGNNKPEIKALYRMVEAELRIRRRARKDSTMVHDSGADH